MFFRRAGHLYNDKFGSANGNRIRRICTLESHNVLLRMGFLGFFTGSVAFPARGRVRSVGSN
jgi:hypothetical protein